MWHSSLVQLAFILVLIQSIEGVGHGLVRHFNTKRQNIDYFERHNPKSDNFIEFSDDDDELPQLRNRRQNMGGVPKAVSSFLPNDTRNYGRVSYSGEGSKVCCL